MRNTFDDDDYAAEVERREIARQFRLRMEHQERQDALMWLGVLAVAIAAGLFGMYIFPYLK